MSPDSVILVGEIGGHVWVRVRGRGTFQSSPALKELGGRLLSRKRGSLVVDLRDCPMMDSTFMGTLTGIALQFRHQPGSEGLHVLNANARNIELLENLGLDQILRVDKDGTAFPDLRREAGEESLRPSETGSLTKSDQAAHVLSAHEILAATSQANKKRFQDVVAYLRAEMERESSGESPDGATAR